MHLRAPGVDVGGFCIPGTPVIIAGRNQRIAWGVTNVMADDADFYLERIDSTDTTRYWYDGSWRRIAIREEEILVRGDTAVPVLIRSTHHGPLISDISTPLTKARPPAGTSMRWTGVDPTDSFEAFRAINRAASWEEFIAGVRQFAGPGQNFIYGDADGNIGYWCGVRLPLRGALNSTLPLPGWEPAAEWKGIVPFEALPHLYNPPEGYIASANHKLVDDSYPYHIGDLWEPPSRIERLHEVLGAGEAFTATDFERLQNDVLSPHARALTPIILAALTDSALGIPEERLVLEYLRNWDFRFSEADIATAIYQSFFVRLLNNIYRDEMGEELFHDFLILVNVPIRVTTRLLNEGTSAWFDDVGTPETETRDMIIRRSLREAVDGLRERFGSATKTWRWGEMHTVTLQHPFGLRPPLDRVFSIGPFPYPGGATALMSGEYSYGSPFAVTVGSSFRQVVDFARPGEARRVLPGGQSGQVLHRHYDDQVHLWLHGGFRTFSSMPPRNGAGWSILQLTPGP
jgi:penicillin amidase